ncbi:winged helix-turn-helix domain-containing protein [Nocardia wallacei]|uniref:winged helix-turn-helix domain-containing protein n=1 Tax=Nocardia wallacei TaxID=480035 RepID=UPI002456E6E1|nr:winged helix-turn-helix domain-containing protein [Nocardia wallacei]
MSSAAAYSARTAGRGLLIAVAGAGPGSGVTTTSVALARTCPGPEPAVVVEANPAGGHLCEATGADPRRGLASMARAAATGDRAASALTEHLQHLPGGVAYLASTPGPDPGPRAAWTTAMLTGTARDQPTGNVPNWRSSGVTVIADCGAPEPGSVTASILAHADARLLVVHADLHEPYEARRRLLALTGPGPLRGILLIGSRPGSDYETALALPVTARLPHHPASATAIVHRTLRIRRNKLLPAARTVAAAVEAHLRPSPPEPTAATTGRQHARAGARRRVRLPGHRAARPRVYRIDLPARPTSRTDPDPQAPPHPTPSPTPPLSSLHGTGHASNGTRTLPEAAPGKPAPPRPRTHAAARSTGGDHVLAGTPSTAGTYAASTAPGTTRAEPEAAVPGADKVTPEARATAPRTPAPVLSVEVFGPLKVLWHPRDRSGPVEITRSLRPRERELLTLLAVHPGGATRDAVIDALWPEHTSRRPANTLNTVVSRLRKAISTAVADTDTEFIASDTSRYRLASGVWDVDYVAFDTAVKALRAATGPTEQERACRAILDAADGILAEELTADWIAPIREHARRDRLKALGKLCSMLIGTDPDQTLALLETAMIIDPTNEPIHQDILRLHARLGERTVIKPTVELLKRCLETIGDIPTQHTLDIANALREAYPGSG